MYDAGAAAFELHELEGKPCWLAVDLSSNNDLTAIVECWRDGEDGYIVWPWFFCPKDNLQPRADRDGVPYPTWAADEFITPTPGNVVDFRAVEACIRDLCERFDVQEIAFDPHLARNTMNNLLEDGFPAVEMRQGWISMAPAVKELERAIIGRKFRHGGHPVLRWNFENIAVETDKRATKAFTRARAATVLTVRRRARRPWRVPRPARIQVRFTAMSKSGRPACSSFEAHGLSSGAPAAILQSRFESATQCLLE